MKNSKLLLTSLLAAATMGTSAYAGFVWNGGETITQELWQTQSSWTLTDGTTWTGVGTGPQTPSSNMWAPMTVANASGTVDKFEGWALGLTLQNANLTVTAIKKFQNNNGLGCTINLDKTSTLSMTLINDGALEGNVTVNTEGVFNLALGRTYDGGGFIANLGSIGIVNISGAYSAKVSSISAKLGNGSSDVLLSIVGGNTVYTRSLVTLSDGATLSNSATYSFTDASDNVLTAVASFGDLDFSKYYAVKDASGYSVSYLVSGISDEVYRWQASGDSSVWSAAVWTKGETTGQNITSDGIAYFGAGDGFASTVTIDAATTVGRLIIDADYTFSGENANHLVMTNGGVVNSGATLILAKSGGAGGGFLRGEIEVAGTLQLNNGDVTGYNGARENNLHTITVDAGGVLKLNHSANETFLGTLNLNGTLSGKDANTRWDMYGGSSQIVVGDGANALIDENVKLVIRRDNAPITVGKDATLTIDGQVLKASLVGQESTWNGVLVKNGAGTLTLNGNVDVTGVTVSAGTLTLNGTVNVTGVTQNAGTLNISGAATIGAVSQTDGTLNFTGANATIASYMGPTYAGGGTNPVTNVGAGANLNVSGEFYLRYEGNGTSTLNVDGDMVVGGALNLSRDGKGIVNVRDGGTLVAASIGFGQNWSGTSKSSEINLASGGTLVAGAMTKLCNNINSSSLNLNGGVLGTNAESLTISVDSLPIVLGTGTTSTINTGKYDTATKTFTDTGAAISIANVISGDGALKKTGAGTLTLSNANIYTGTTTVEAGTLVAGNASALGAGNVVVADGATLARGLTSGSVAIGGTLTTNGAAILSTGALDAGTAAFAVTGDVTLSAGTIFDVGSLVDGKLVSSAGTLTIADSGTLTKANFLLNGGSLGSRTTFDISTSGNAVTISNVQQTALTLTWLKFDPSGSAVWSNGCSGWSYQESAGSVPSSPETFQTGDSVIFSDDLPSVKNVVVDGVVSVGTMTIDSDADFAFSGQNGAAITSSGALTKSGTGTATIDSSVDLSRIGGGIVVEENGGKLVVDTASGYAGAVTAGANGTFTLNVSSDTTLANTLSGAGTFEKTGAGTLTVSTANTGLEGQFVISEGTVKLGSAGSDLFGGQSNTEANKNRYAVQVSSGGTLDMNGQNDISYRVTLSGGSLVNNGNDIGVESRQLYGIQLTADSEIGGSNKFGLLASMYAQSNLNLGAHTLTKTGNNVFMLVSTAVTGTGTIDVQAGSLWLANGDDNNDDSKERFSMDSGVTIKLNGGTITAGSKNTTNAPSVALGNVAIVFNDANKDELHIKADRGVSFNAAGATLYLDIGALLTDATLTPGEDVSLTIAAASAIANDSFFSAVEVGTYVDDVWQISSDWKYLADSWSASAGTLTITAIPEPSMFGLLAGLGALALAGTRRRRRKA